jgi:hypothetical protein
VQKHVALLVSFVGGFGESRMNMMLSRGLSSY